MTMIQLQGISLEFPHKTCFSDFTAAIDWGQRIAIVGDNGAGKSSLLRILHGSLAPSHGKIDRPAELGVGYVEQIHLNGDTLSGGQRVNLAISRALGAASDLLLLDEPTNHLDADNRRSLTRMLSNYYGSIVLVTHDEALMDQVCDTVWHIGHGQIHVFAGRYADFLAQRELERDAIEKQLLILKRGQREAHAALMQEQERASHAKQRGIQSIQRSKWATIKSPTKLARGTITSVRKTAGIKQQREDLAAQLAQLPRDIVIQPQFHLAHAIRPDVSVLQISDGSVGYDRPLLAQLFITINQGERVALTGKNGCGKSTVARAISGDPTLVRSGVWYAPKREDIGYLDQHYANLNPRHTISESIAEVVPEWSELAVRRHLSDFLFRQNDTAVANLSGGEKARLSLARIAARPPHLLILDEITNNLDRRMRQHVIGILKVYPGAMLLISHDEDFLDQVGQVQRIPLLQQTSVMN
jgi:ATPase subunit of ABC transporter with duplicated ATPase domains